jgi:hypothetical protein
MTDDNLNFDDAYADDVNSNSATADDPASADAEREARLRELTDNGDLITPEQYRTRSRRSFLSFAGLGLAGYWSFRTVQNRPRDQRIPDVLRRGYEINEDIWEALSRDGARARTFAIEDRQDIRVNGRNGLDPELAPDAADTWEIEVTGLDGGALDPIDLDAIKALETHDMVWEHKCIEGWSNIVHWTGVRFSDVLRELIPGEQSDWNYVSMRTPDSEYYVGLERYTMLHPQTLLAWRLNGETLSAGHGAPIRLVTPLKYGIKQLKRIGAIEFTSEKPDDYWAERGYDYHSGL